MISYKYVARDLSGQRKEGYRQAACSNDVLGWLREQGFTPVTVKAAPAAPKRTRRKRIKSADLSSLFWQLTTMLEGGIPVTTALETIGDDIDNKQLQQILKQILERMLKGETFSSSAAEYPKVFNKLACAMILAGETSGKFPMTLRRLAEYFENRDRLAKRVKGAMAYPAFVVVFIILIVVFMMAFIIPRFRTIFDQLGSELPAFTRVFMRVYDVIWHNIGYMVISVLLAIIMGVVFSKTKKGHHLFCKIALGFPLIGKILTQAFLVLFCRTMSTLLSSGVPVLEVFDIITSMTNNEIITSAMIRARERIVAGSNISTGMGTAGFFPNLVIKMVQVGEESGSLPKVLDRTAVGYERKVDTLVTTIMNLLEPIMIVTVGAIVLVVVLALYLPIFSLSG